MYLFPHLCRELILSVWDWGGGRTSFLLFLFFFFFKAENQKDTNISINHDLWSCLFFCGKPDIFFQLNKKPMAFSIVSVTPDSLWGFCFTDFFFCLFVFSLVFFSFFFCWMTAHQGSWALSPCVCLDAGRTLDLHPDRRLLYLFKLAHPGCRHTAAIVL